MGMRQSSLTNVFPTLDLNVLQRDEEVSEEEVEFKTTLFETNMFYDANANNFNWSKVFPKAVVGQRVGIAVIGCENGNADFLVSLVNIYPGVLSVGLELGPKSNNHLIYRIKDLRKRDSIYNDIACIANDDTKCLIDYFSKAQLAKIFFLCPDPNCGPFEKDSLILQKHIVLQLGYVLINRGLLYTMTDRKDLHLSMIEQFTKFKVFECVDLNKIADDPALPKINESFETNEIKYFIAVFRRLPSDDIMEESDE